MSNCVITTSAHVHCLRRDSILVIEQRVCLQFYESHFSLRCLRWRLHPYHFVLGWSKHSEWEESRLEDPIDPVGLVFESHESLHNSQLSLCPISCLYLLPRSFRSSVFHRSQFVNVWGGWVMLCTLSKLMFAVPLSKVHVRSYAAVEVPRCKGA